MPICLRMYQATNIRGSTLEADPWEPNTSIRGKCQKEVLIIEGVREDWAPKPVKVVESKVGFVDSLQLHGAVLANAFVIHNIPYYWKKGRKDKWKP